MSSSSKKARDNPCPSCYDEILQSGLRRGTDFLILDGNIERISACLIAAPHGGKIEPGTSEVVKAVAELGPWAWYSFEGRLPSRNWRRLHVTSSSFDEPRFSELVSQTSFVVSLHGMKGNRRKILLGGRSAAGRSVFKRHLDAALEPWNVKTTEADGSNVGIGGLARDNLVNRGRNDGVQLEISRGLRRLLAEDRAVFVSLRDAMQAAMAALVTA